MISVLYVHTRFDSPGGANSIAVETANRLSARPDFDLAIATASFNRDLYTLDSSVRLHEIGGGSPGSITHWVKLPVILRRLAAVIEAENIDVVMFHSIPTPYWAAYLQHTAPNVRFLWYAHDPNAYLNLPGKLRDIPTSLRTVVRAGLPAVCRFDQYVISSFLDGVIANSEFTQDIVQNVYDVESRVVYPGIDFPRFENITAEASRMIFTVGQLNQYKNYDMLIRAMEHVDERLTDPPKLVIAGTGSYQEELSDLARIHGVTDLIEFVGYLSDSELVDHYAKAMVTAYLPENEPFGLVPVESMAAGTPVVAVDSGGIRETVVDGETGQLISEFSDTAVADALIDLLSDPDRNVEMGQRAKERVTSMFTIEKTVDGIARLLVDITSLESNNE